MDYRNFGILAFIILQFGLLFILVKWPQGKHLSFSQHIAISKKTIIYYIIMFSIVLPILLLFFLKWFMPTFQLSIWFGIFITISTATQFLCTLIPEIGGWKTNIHRLLAGVSALSLLPALVVLAFSGNISFFSKVVVVISSIIMSFVISEIIMGKGKHANFLVLQTIYFLAFFIPIFYINYMQR